MAHKHSLRVLRLARRVRSTRQGPICKRELKVDMIPTQHLAVLLIELFQRILRVAVRERTYRRDPHGVFAQAEVGDAYSVL